MSTDTNAHDIEAIEAEVVPPDPLGLGALMGGLDLGALMGSLGVELPDPDASTIEDVMDELAELRACVDWLADTITAVTAKVPAKFRPDLAPYPPTIDG